MYPEATRTNYLQCGQVGYLLLILENEASSFLSICDTLVPPEITQQTCTATRKITPFVFVDLYPDQNADKFRLRDALYKLVRNDPSVILSTTKCKAFGQGWQVGFLGFLHMQVFKERLEQEYDESVLLTPAFVGYRCRTQDEQLHELTVSNYDSFQNHVKAYLQPIVSTHLFFPHTYLPEVTALMKRYNANKQSMHQLSEGRLCASYHLPFVAFCRGLYDRLKKVTRGYGSLEYEQPFYHICDVVKVDMEVNKVQIDALSLLCERKEATLLGPPHLSGIEKIPSTQHT